MKKVFRSIVIFWGIVAVFPLCYLISAFFTIGGGSYWVFGARDGLASATAWLDGNANGIQDAGENPMENVCIWGGNRPEMGRYEYADPCNGNKFNSTDEQGNWTRFLPGGRCEEFYVFAKAPEGHRATTNLASKGCDAKFGFTSNNDQVRQKIYSIEQFIQREIMILWIKRIVISLAILVTAVLGTIWLQK